MGQSIVQDISSHPPVIHQIVPMDGRELAGLLSEGRARNQGLGEGGPRCAFPGDPTLGCEMLPVSPLASSQQFALQLPPL